jgi:hypothetical protein
MAAIDWFLVYEPAEAALRQADGEMVNGEITVANGGVWLGGRHSP